MSENRQLTCIVCPLGCSMEVMLEGKIVKSVKGFKCNRGENYAVTECSNPKRTLTTTVKIKNGEYKLIPVKSEQPIPKELVRDCVTILNTVEIQAPIKVGDIIVHDILNTGVNIVATRNIELKDANIPAKVSMVS